MERLNLESPETITVSPSTTANNNSFIIRFSTDLREVKWKTYSDQTSGYIDLAKLFSPKKDVVSYAYRTENLPEAKVMKFGLGSNDGVRVWVNDKLVLDRMVSRAATPNDDQVRVPMRKGENSILVKVDQLGKKWGFYFTERE